MTILLEFRERIRGFYGKYEIYLLPVIKFLVAFSAFSMINYRIGYMERLNSLSLLLILALVCSILPTAVMLLSAGVLITLHLYALSMPACVIMAVLLAVMYLLYFRFTPHDAYNALLAPMAFALGIPYALPAVNGLLQQPVSVIPTACGVIAYYFVEGLAANETGLKAVGEEDELIARFQEIIKQLAGNREMYLTLAIFMATAVVVYVIRRLSIDYAWTVAIVVGMLMQYIGFFAGYLEIGQSSMTMRLTVGCAVSVILLLVIQFFCFNLDYMRTERVQFEDDEYYYYVKAVPKRYVPAKAKTVKKISGDRRGRGSVTREELIEDMDIDMGDE